MIHAVVAESAGVTLGDLDSLLTGRVYASIAGLNWAFQWDISESYISSGSAAAVFWRNASWGKHAGGRRSLGVRLGREGRIGLTLLASCWRIDFLGSSSIRGGCRRMESERRKWYVARSHSHLRQVHAPKFEC